MKPKRAGLSNTYRYRLHDIKRDIKKARNAGLSDNVDAQSELEAQAQSQIILTDAIPPNGFVVVHKG